MNAAFSRSSDTDKYSVFQLSKMMLAFFGVYTQIDKTLSDDIFRRHEERVDVLEAVEFCLVDLPDKAPEG